MIYSCACQIFIYLKYGRQYYHTNIIHWIIIPSNVYTVTSSIRK